MKTSGKIIIADHQPEVTAPIHQVLQQVGYHAFEAHNEKDCLNLIFSHRPDVLLIDVHLPHGDGEEFCKQIKLNHDLPNLHIILMSEIDEEALKVDFNKPDYFDDLITKPIHAKELLLKLSMFELIKNMKAAFKKQKSSYEGILAGLSDLVINTDTHGNIVNMNLAAETISGWKLKDVEGEKSGTILKIFDELSRLPQEYIVEKTLQENPAIKQSSTGVMITKDGEELLVQYSVVPIYDEENELNGAIAIVHPVKAITTSNLVDDGNHQEFKSYTLNN